MSIEVAADPVAHTIVKLPALGTLLPHLGGTFWALMRSKPNSGEPDYALIVPHGPEFEKQCAWGGAGSDVPGAACQFDGQANTKALLASGSDHPAAAFCNGLNVDDMTPLYLPSLRELKALFASGCDAFDPEGWYWSSTQYSRDVAFIQHFGYGGTGDYDKRWESGRARAVRRASIESLIP